MADEGGFSNKPCVEGLQVLLCASTTAWTYQVPISQGKESILLRPHIEKDKQQYIRPQMKSESNIIARLVRCIFRSVWQLSRIR